MRLAKDRFDNYRTITAKFASTCSCGWEIKPGETIGYNPLVRRAICDGCWHRWQSENREAAAAERGECCY